LTTPPDQIVATGDTFTIFRTFHPGPAVPYPSFDHRDGTLNHGFTDLRNRAHLASGLPETKGNPAFGLLVRRLNENDSPLMTLGCEQSIFDVEEPAEDGPAFYIGSYIDVAFRKTENASQTNIETLAREIVAVRNLTVDDWTRLELGIQELRHFFGARGCFSLMLKIISFGRDENETATVFNHQCQQMQRTFDQIFLKINADSGGTKT
jgi:hypothetical protein